MPEDLEYSGFSGVRTFDNEEEKLMFLCTLPGYRPFNYIDGIMPLNNAD